MNLIPKTYVRVASTNLPTKGVVPFATRKYQQREMDFYCDLQLNHESEIYKPSEVVSGRVVLTLLERALIKAFAIKISGYAAVRWEKNLKSKKLKKKQKDDVVTELTDTTKAREYFINREDYLSTTNYFIGSEEALPQIIDKGAYSYTFGVPLPEHCPSSFEGSLGHVRYEVNVFIDSTDGRRSCLTRAVRLQRPLDLRDSMVLVSAGDSSAIEKKSATRFWQRPMQLYLNVPQTGYVPREGVSVHVKLLNYERLKLTELVYKLNLIGTYTGYSKKKSKEQIQRTNLVKTMHSLFGQNSAVVQHLQTLHVPETPPTIHRKNCKCLQVSYEIEVTVYTTKRKRTLSVAVPITIGTISLQSNLKTTPCVYNESVPALTHAVIVSESSVMASVLGSAPPLEEQAPNLSASLGSLNSTFREADYMTATNLNKPNKHCLEGDHSAFKPKYLYYDMDHSVQESEITTTSMILESNQIDDNLNENP